MAQKKVSGMTVREAGQKGGRKVRDLIEEGKKTMGGQSEKGGNKTSR